MKRRCKGTSKNPNDRIYASVKIYSPWVSSFHRFMIDVGPRPTKLHTLDRYPDQSGNYTPGNVRWATKSEQSVNRRSTRILTFMGRSLPLSYWAKELGLDRHLIERRLKEGLSVDQVLAPGPDQPVTLGFTDGLVRGKKLNSDQVSVILSKAANGDSNLTELGREFGVAPTSILNLTRKFGVVVKKRYTQVRTP